LSGYIFVTKAYIDSRKKLVKQQYVLHMCLQYGELRPTNGWDLLASLGHPSKFQRVSCLGSVTARHCSSGGQSNFAALNRERHLYSAGRPSRCALARFLVFTSSAMFASVSLGVICGSVVKLINSLSSPALTPTCTGHWWCKQSHLDKLLQQVALYTCACLLGLLEQTWLKGVFDLAFSCTVQIYSFFSRWMLLCTEFTDMIVCNHVICFSSLCMWSCMIVVFSAIIYLHKYPTQLWINDFERGRQIRRSWDQAFSGVQGQTMWWEIRVAKPKKTEVCGRAGYICLPDSQCCLQFLYIFENSCQVRRRRGWRPPESATVWPRFH